MRKMRSSLGNIGRIAMIAVLSVFCLPSMGVSQVDPEDVEWEEIWRVFGGNAVDNQELTLHPGQVIARTNLPQSRQWEVVYDGVTADGDWVLLTIVSNQARRNQRRFSVPSDRKLRYNRFNDWDATSSLVEVGENHSFTAFTSPRLGMYFDPEDVPIGVNLIIDIEDVDDGRMTVTVEQEVIERD